MNVETFNYSPESLAPFFYLNKRDRKNIYIFPTEKETLEFYNNFSKNNSVSFWIKRGYNTANYEGKFPKHILNFIILSFLLLNTACQLRDPTQTHGINFLENREKQLILTETNKNDTKIK